MTACLSQKKHEHGPLTAPAASVREAYWLVQKYQIGTLKVDAMEEFLTHKY